jgi:hypothetical protein
VSIWIWIALAIGAVIVFWILVAYNRLVAMRQHCNQAFAHIDVQLKQGYDLVPNLVETVKGYASHEQDTLDAVVQARNAAAVTQGPAAEGQAVRRSPTPAVRFGGSVFNSQGQQQFRATSERLDRHLEQARCCAPFVK